MTENEPANKIDLLKIRLSALEIRRIVLQARNGKWDIGQALAAIACEIDFIIKSLDKEEQQSGASTRIILSPQALRILRTQNIEYTSDTCSVLRCKKCGALWSSQAQFGGTAWPRKWWACPSGCNDPDRRRYSGSEFLGKLENKSEPE